MQLSYWEKERFFEQVDACVIGSGIVGLSTAIELKRQRPDWEVIILERGFLPYGASTRNAGFACFGSVSELMDDFGRMGESQTIALVERRWRGLLNLRQLLGDQSIGLENFGGYELFDDAERYELAADAIEKLNDLLKAIIGKQVYATKPSAVDHFGFKGFIGTIKNQFESQINTGEMMHALLKLARKEGVIILNGIGVDQVKGKCIVTTEGFSFEANAVIVTTNGFAKQLLPQLEVEPARAQVLVTEPIPGLKLKGTFHFDEGYYYFRNIGNRILLGGGRNLDFVGENSTNMIQTPIIQERLEQMLFERIVPYAKPKIEMRWSGVMGVGETRSPLVQKLDEHLYCAVRMGGMGVAIGSLVGKEVAALVLEN